MAFITEIHCFICGETKREVTFHDNKCSKCRALESSRAKRTHLASLLGLTIEERLAKIEVQLYDLNAEKRLSILEVQNARF